MSTFDRRRWFHLCSLPLVIALGLASRHWPIGVPLYDDALGDALYAVMVYLVLAIVLPGRRALHLAIAACAICLAIELFKLTGYPHAWRRFTISRLVFGTSFDVRNLVRYADYGNRHSPFGWELDVIVPSNLGGSTDPENLQVLHWKAGAARKESLPPGLMSRTNIAAANY